MSILGTRVLRTEDPTFLTTGGTYVADLRDPRLTGAAHVTYVRSSVAHGRLLDVDVSEARDAPGVVGVFTAADVDLADRPPFIGMINQAMARPWLARDVVRFVGEPVAVVVTERSSQGEDAAERVLVDIDPLPAVVDPRAAARDETLLFPDAGTNTAVTFELGEPASLFDGCEVVVRQEVVNSRVAPAPMEVRSAACAWGDDGRLTFWVSTQSPHSARDQLAAALGLEPSQVHVITPDVGGGFGAKFGASQEDMLLAWLARRLGRPMRWTETRSESLQAMGHGRAQRQTVTIGGRRDGTVTAYALDVLQDAGAYPHFGAFLPYMTRLMTSGVYAVPAVAFRSRSVVTNTAPVVAYRGAGRPEATAAVERAMDLFAAEIGADPAEVRRRNLLPADAFPHRTAAGATYDSGDYATALARVLEAAGYDTLRAEQARRRRSGEVRQLGIGLSTYVEITGDGGPGSEMARVEVSPGGDVVVHTGTSPHGQGHATSWAMIAADSLGVPLERITVRHGDTDLLERGGGTGGSRSLQLGGAAVGHVAELTVQRARELAAELFEADAGDVRLDLDRGVFHVAGSPDDVRSWAQVAAAADPTEGLAVQGVFDAAAATFPFGAHLAVVEVDLQTGQVALTRVVTVDDAGRVVNPVTFEGQRHGGIAQGAAQALLEEAVYDDDDGNPLTASFADYAIVTATDVPSFELLDMQTPTPINPLGAKGVGEAGTIGATPAVQNAVIDAVAHLGVRHIDMPTTAEKVWRAIQEATR